MNSATGTDWQHGIDDHGERIVIDTRHRLDVAQHANVQLFVERHVDGMRRGDQQHRVAIGRRTRDRLQGEIAAAAGAVFDDDGLAEPLRQRLSNQPRDDIGCSAGRHKDHQSDRPRRIALR